MRRGAIDGALGSTRAPNRRVGESGPARTGWRRAGLPMPSRGLTGVIVLVLMVLVGLSSDDPVRESSRMRLVPGEPDVQALGFALSPDGRTIATALSDGRWTLGDLRDDRGGRRVVGPRGLIWGLAFSPDGRSLVLGGYNPRLGVLDLAGGGSWTRLETPFARIRTLAFSPDGRILAASAERDGEILLWDLAADRERARLRGHFTALSLAFSPDGRSLAAGERYERRVTLWDVETGQSRLISGARTGPMTSVAFSPDGGLLAAAGPTDRLVRLWEPSSGRLHLQLAGHVGGTTSVGFSPDGRRLATAGNDGMVRIWKATTGELLTRLDGRSSWLSQVAFSADGRTLAAAGGDSHIRVWDLDDIEETTVDRAPVVDRRRRTCGSGRRRSGSQPDGVPGSQAESLTYGKTAPPTTSAETLQ